MNACLTIENATVIYPGNPEAALKGLNFTLRKGRHAAISGPNGSGKSTLLRLMAGMLWTVKGTVAWADKGGMETSRISGQKLTRLLSPATQETWQRRAWGGTGLDILHSALAPFAQSDKEDTEKALTLLAKLGASHLASMPLNAMSQGQLRLLLFCRACLAKPTIILLDEFMDSLDEQARKSVFKHLETMREDATIVFATHRQERLPDWVAEWWSLNNGRILKASRPTAFKKSPPLPVPPARTDVPPACEIKNATVFIERRKILHDINWIIRLGECWRLTGPNGSGKSTLLRLLVGQEFAAAGGKVSVFTARGDAVENLPQLCKTVALVSDLSQARYDYNLKGWELVCSGVDGTVGIYRDFTPEEREAAFAWLECFAGREGLELAGKSIRSLSTGQLRKLFLARAFVNRPSLLLFDEPCNGLDAEGREDFLECLRKVATGVFGGWRPAMAMVSHYPEDIPDWFQKTARLEAGTLKISLPPA